MAGSRAQVCRSDIEGHGLFATAPIATGEIILELGDTVIDDSQLAELQPRSSLAIAEGLNLRQDDDDASQFGNHACDPNMWMSDVVTVVARWNIERDEELTIDYALMAVASRRMDCCRGASTCRSSITGNNWQSPALQRLYKGHFSPFISERIRTREANSL